MKLNKFISIILSLMILSVVFCGVTACSNTNDTNSGVILFELQNENLTLSTPVSNCECTVFVNGVKKGSTFSVKKKEVVLPKFIFNSSAGKVVNVELKFLSEEEVISTKEYAIDVVDIAIDTAEEFLAWYSTYKTNYDKAEYVILTKDITLSSEGVIDNWRMSTWLQMMYTGTFDGRGHVIYNFASKYGFIPNMGKGSCIKNLAMVNMTTTEGTQGFLGAHLCGAVIENCYFQGQHTATDEHSRYTGFYGRYFDDKYDNGYVERVENVVIDVKRSSVGEKNDAFADTGFAILPINRPFINVIMANDCYNGKAFLGRTWNELDVTVYDSSFEMKESITTIPSGFSPDYWHINEKGYLTFKSVK